MKKGQYEKLITVLLKLQKRNFKFLFSEINEYIIEEYVPINIIWRQNN